MLRGFSCGNDADDATTIMLAVANQEEVGVGATTHAKHEEAIFICGVGVVVELHGKLVIENRLSLLEGDAMLPEV